MTATFPDQDLEALLYKAWVVIANVSGGNWDEQSDEWVEAATAWRNAWHDTFLGDSASGALLRELTGE